VFRSKVANHASFFARVPGAAAARRRRGNMPAARGTYVGSVLLLRGACTGGSAARTARAPRGRAGEFLCWATFMT